MNFNKREKIIAVMTGSLLAVLAIYWFWPSQEVSLAELRVKHDLLERGAISKKNQADKAIKILDRLQAWQRRALPSEPAIAKSLYQNWLLKLVDRVNFQNVTISSPDPQSLRNIYTLYFFNVQCQGTLENLTQFLHEFYLAGHLHKIRTLSITPVKNSSDIQLNISVEALSLPGSAQKDKLSAEPGKSLKLASLENYKKTIVSRNLFTAYTKQTNDSSKDSKTAANIDPLQFSYLTAIIEADGVAEAWLFERSTGETLKVHEGEEFNIAKVRGKVIRIGYNEIEIEIDGQSHTVGYGNNLKM